MVIHQCPPGWVQPGASSTAALTSAIAQIWTIENRIVRGELRFQMKTVMGVANACSHIQLLDVKGTGWLFSLQPVTGKTCQRRLHMSGPGFRIINARIYPKLQPNETLS
jgi:tRNA pseudouridine32 synthase / 23S rRNA pseudouridine746 synthase